MHEAVVVTGFHDELVQAAIAARSGGPNVRTIFNPFYKVADNTGSLYMAREELAGDCLVWNGDTLVSNALMARVVDNDRAGICVTIDRKDGYDDDDMKVVEDGGRLQRDRQADQRGRQRGVRSGCSPFAGMGQSSSGPRSSARCGRAKGRPSGICG